MSKEQRDGGAHDWARSTLGHGEVMCRHCKMTNREAAVLGQMDVCEAAPKRAEPAPTPDHIKNRAILAMAETICQCDLTDGFCMPARNPDCRCIKFARMAWQGLGSRGLVVCWPVARVDPFFALATRQEDPS